MFNWTEPKTLKKYMYAEISPLWTTILRQKSIICSCEEEGRLNVHQRPSIRDNNLYALQRLAHCGQQLWSKKQLMTCSSCEGPVQFCSWKEGLDKQTFGDPSCLCATVGKLYLMDPRYIWILIDQSSTWRYIYKLFEVSTQITPLPIDALPAHLLPEEFLWWLI